jgi:hypothetical protein
VSGHLLKSNDLDVAKSKNIHMIIEYAVIGCGHAVDIIKGAALAVTSPSNSRKKDTTYVILHL